MIRISNPVVVHCWSCGFVCLPYEGLERINVMTRPNAKFEEMPA